MFDIIVLDLDGTLLRSNKTISEKTIEILKQHESSGKKIVIATARPPRVVEKILPPPLAKSIRIVYNGAEIYQGNTKIHSKYISRDSVKKIIDLSSNSFKNSKISLEINNELYSNYNVEEYFGKIQYKQVDFSCFNLKPAAKVLIDLTEITDWEQFRGKLPEQCTMVVTDNNTLGQIMDKDVSKLNAIKYILKDSNIGLDKVVAFGDDFNDIEIIKECGVGVAMGNAVQELKDISDYVTKTNDEDGIAFFLDNVYPLARQEHSRRGLINGGRLWKQN